MTIALWCIFIAATLPYVPFSYVKGLDPIQPRHHVGDLAERSLRAYGAHLNGLETFPWFAAAVIVSPWSVVRPGSPISLLSSISWFGLAT